MAFQWPTEKQGQLSLFLQSRHTLLTTTSNGHLNYCIQPEADNVMFYTCAAAHMTSMCCVVMQHSAARKLRMI